MTTEQIIELVLDRVEAAGKVNNNVREQVKREVLEQIDKKNKTLLESVNSTLSEVEAKLKANKAAEENHYKEIKNKYTTPPKVDKKDSFRK